jgi:4-carboxymuconolactone decarboxylase
MIGGISNDGMDQSPPCWYCWLMTEQRIKPIPAEDWDESLSSILTHLKADYGTPPNALSTIANHPPLLRRFVVLQSHVRFKTKLSGREKEILTLRTSARCHGEYEWGRHEKKGRDAGLTDDQIKALRDEVPVGPHLWSASETSLIQAADDLCDDCTISDASWAALAEHYDMQTMMDVVFFVGSYRMLSCATNSFGVRLEDAVSDSVRFRLAN